MKVLIAEDDADIQTILKMVLTKLGKATTFSAYHGNEVLPLALKEKPDLILLDVMLPDMNGFEICQTLKATAEVKETPVIYLSAVTSPVEIQRGLSMGALGYLAKPFDPSTLIQEINLILRPLGLKLGS